MRTLTVVLPFLVWAPTLGAQNVDCDTSEYALFAARQSLPRKFWELFRQSGLAGEYDVNVRHVNPFYLWGDFDGDGSPDFVVRLRKRSQSERGQLACVGGNGRVSWLARDSLLRYPDPGAWYVHANAQPVKQGVREDKPPVLRGDALMMIAPEMSSALVFWNGERFVSFWQGD